MAIDYDHCPQPLPGYLIANIVILSILLALILPLVGLRLYTRISVVRGLWWDDAAIIIATLLFIPFWAFSIDLSRKRVIGLWPCVPHADQESVHWEWKASLETGYLSGMFSRISVALLLLKLFSIKRGVKAFLAVLTILMAAFVIFNVVTTYHQGGLRVSKINVHLTVLAGADFAFTDLALSTLPILFIRNLTMPRRLRIAAIGILALGYVTTAFAIWRIAEYASPSPPNPHHQIFAPQWSTLACELELACAIIVTCLPSVRPYFTQRKMTERQRYYRSRSGSKPLGDDEGISLGTRASRGKSAQVGVSERSGSDSAGTRSPPTFAGVTRHWSDHAYFGEQDRPFSSRAEAVEDDAEGLVPRDGIGKRTVVEVV